MIFRRLLPAAAAAVVILPNAGLAHTGHGASVGLLSGLAHPLSGLDHGLAMLLVGVLAVRQGGRALWALPVSFLAMMSLGAVLGAGAVALPQVEIGIALSLIVFGLAAAAAPRAPLALGVAVVGGFALFHGHAHGTEMSAAGRALSYGAGMLMATALLHAAGIALGLELTRTARRHGPVLLRVVGGGAALIGAAIAGGAI